MDTVSHRERLKRKAGNSQRSPRELDDERWLRPHAEDLWVFGYGSLMWRPGFSYKEVHSATLYGYHRALCMWCEFHRGTPQQPGLVLGLMPGGSCVGLVFRIENAAKESTLAYLYDREMVTAAYVPQLVNVRLNRRRVRALTFTSDPRHPRFAGKLDPDVAASVVKRAVGRSGTNLEYLTNTLSELNGLGVRDAYLRQLVRALR